MVDWHGRQKTKDGKPPANVFRLLPRGYSQYTRNEAEVLAKKDMAPRRDAHRDVRLLPGQERHVRAALAEEKRLDRERSLDKHAGFTMLFDLIVDTGLRLSEAFKMRLDQVDLVRGVLRVEGSKGARGAIKPRVVPLKRPLRAQLERWVAERQEIGALRLFSFWDGTPEDVRRTTLRLSARFSTLFKYAGLKDFTEHDLRREATCRWFELRNERGWVFSDIEICRLMGWTDTRMALCYASLRGEDLADRL